MGVSLPTHSNPSGNEMHKRNKGLPWWLRGKESACSVGDQGSIPGTVRSPGGGNGNPTPVFFGEFHGQKSLQSMGSQRVGHD